MKRQSFYKNLLRTIYKSSARFFSILVIIALGVGFYAGINATEPDMILSADKYYKDQNLSDIKIINPLGFKKRDITQVSEISGVIRVQEGFYKDLFTTNKEGETSVARIYSYNSDDYADNLGLNAPVLVEGRMPEKPGEIVVEKGLITSEIKIGSVLTLKLSKGEKLKDFLKTSEFKVVGVVISPLYISFERDQTNIGDGSVEYFAYVHEKAFSMDRANNLFVKAEDSEDLIAYSDAYNIKIEEVQKKIEKAGQKLMKREKDKAQNKLRDGKRILQEKKSEAMKKFSDSEKDLLDAEKEIEKGKEKLVDKEKRLTRKLNKERALLNKGRLKINDGKKELEEKYREWQLAYQKYEKGLEELKQAKVLLGEMDSQIISMEAQLKAVEEGLTQGKVELDKASSELNEKEMELDQGEKALDKAFAELEKGLAEGREKLENSKKKLDEGWEKLKKEKVKVLDRFREKEDELAEAEELISDIPDEWFVFNRDHNPSYASLGEDAKRIGAVAKVFPLFFFLVAALVCLTTMTRMIEEERGEIGTLKGLGYGPINISLKYLIYGLLSSLAGTLVGLAIGYRLFPAIIMNAYAIIYNIPERVTKAYFSFSLISFVLAVVTTLSATLFASMKELRTTPAALIQPRAPRPGKRIFLERITPLWNKLSFLHKVTARNLFRYKRRFFMTVVGIAGCTALLLTGFGLMDSINDVLDKQFDEIFVYDGLVVLDVDKNPKNGDFDDILGDERIKSYLPTFNEAGNARSRKLSKEYEVNLFVVEDARKMEEFIKLNERKSKTQLELSDEGAIITEKLSALLDLGIGDILRYRNNDNKMFEVRITGISENYISHYIFMTPQYYQKTTNEAVAYNSAVFNLVDLEGLNESAFVADIMDNDLVIRTIMTGSISGKVKDSMDSLDIVVLILILSAGALAFVVLYNLTNINITERIREIATIKVLGFRDYELSVYIFRENIVLTIFGIMTGLLLGLWLHWFVIQTMEIDSMMFGRVIHLDSYVFSIILTLVFSALVNFYMHFKLRKVDMVESLKSVD